jgi:DNA-directed RNA polymerase subunit RPC12/RpoP
MASTAVAFDDDVYEISAAEVAQDIPSQWQSAATYTLELPVRCPHCDEKLRTIRVVGLVRSQVSFTSTLPRKGRVAVCPECDRILPVELSGMM